jgi:hypothetical protein
MKRILQTIYIIVASLMIALGLATTAYATAPPPNNSLAISPAIEQVSLNKGQTSVSFNAQVINSSTVPLIVQIDTSDFTALGNNGSVAFINQGAGENLHGLKKWLKPSLNELILQPGTKQIVPISIVDTSSLAPGGHYGAVVFKVVPKPVSTKSNSLSNKEELSMLVFLTTSSGQTQNIVIDKPQISKIVTTLPSVVNINVTNTGNTQTSPSGLITVVNSSNQEIAKGVINQDSGLVLPATNRLYQVPLTYVKKNPYPGVYKLNIDYQASSLAKAQIYSAKVLLINKSLIILIFILVLSFLIFAGYQSNKLKNIYKTKP